MNALIIGVLCLLAGSAQMLREVLLGPEAPNYPSAPFWVRIFMFGWMVALFIRGADLLFGVAGGHPQPLGLTAVVATLAMTAALVAKTVHLLRQRLPARFWRRINRALYLTHCGAHRHAGEAMAKIAMEGGFVAAPGESVHEVLAEHASDAGYSAALH